LPQGSVQEPEFIDLAVRVESQKVCLSESADSAFTRRQPSTPDDASIINEAGKQIVSILLKSRAFRSPATFSTERVRKRQHLCAKMIPAAA
jgi:hypothetical protein